MVGRASDPTADRRPGDAIGAAITISLLRVINKIQQGRRIPRDYGAGVSMTLLEAEMCALIGQRDRVTGSELSEELAVTRSATSQIISKLKDKGLVTERAIRTRCQAQTTVVDHSRTSSRPIADDFKAAMADALFGGESAAELRAYLRFVTKLEAFHSEVITQSEGEIRSPARTLPGPCRYSEVDHLDTTDSRIIPSNPGTLFPQ